MNKLKILLILFLVAFVNQLIAQRTLEAIIPSDSYSFSAAAVLDDQAYVAEYLAPTILQYDGSTLLPINLPLRSGSQLFYSGGNLVAFQGSIYLLLTSNYLDSYLYQFDGINFHEILIPDLSPNHLPYKLIGYEDKLYILTQYFFSFQQDLHSYDGINPVVNTGVYIPDHNLNANYALSGGDLFFYGEDGFLETVMSRFNGTGFTYLPTLQEFPRKIVTIPASDEVYVLTDASILRSDADGWTEVYDRIRASSITNFLEWRGDIYFQVSFDSSSGLDPILYKYDGSTLTTVSLPAGHALIPFAEGAIYEDSFYIPSKLSAITEGILQYNGISFSNFFLFTEVTASPEIFVRGNELIIVPQYQASDTIVSFNDGVFTEVIAFAGTNIYNNLAGTDCFHLWNSILSDGSEYILSKEEVCPTSGASSIIPEYFKDLKRIDWGVRGYYRDWCWTDIFLDWEINPICPIPEACPDPPVFVSTLTDLKGKIGWQETFDQPFKTSIPLDDKQSYQLNLSGIKNDLPESLMVLDSDLVALGFAEVNISMMPAEDYFKLSVSTDQDKKLPFVMKLLNAKGGIIWKQEFTAPMSSEIQAIVDKPGTSLQFSSVSSSIKKLTDYGITTVKYYPNPSYGRLELAITTGEDMEVPVEVSIYNAQGKLVIQRKMMSPVLQTLNLEDQNPGLYLIKIKTGTAVYTDYLIIKD